MPRRHVHVRTKVLYLHNKYIFKINGIEILWNPFFSDHLTFRTIVVSFLAPPPVASPAVRCPAVRCPAVRCAAVRCPAVCCLAVRCSAARCPAARFPPWKVSVLVNIVMVILSVRCYPGRSLIFSHSSCVYYCDFFWLYINYRRTSLPCRSLPSFAVTPFATVLFLLVGC